MLGDSYNNVSNVGLYSEMKCRGILFKNTIIEKLHYL